MGIAHTVLFYYSYFFIQLVAARALYFLFREPLSEPQPFTHTYPSEFSLRFLITQTLYIYTTCVYYAKELEQHAPTAQDIRSTI